MKGMIKEKKKIKTERFQTCIAVDYKASTSNHFTTQPTWCTA